jgi:Tfp pilus assembly protein PilO
MSKSVQQGRARVALIALAAALVLIVMWYTLLDTPRAQLQAKTKVRADLSSKLDQARKQIAEAAQTKVSIQLANQRLQEMEVKMPIGDPYRWLVKAFLDFPAAARITLANIEPPHITESTILPKVPYKTATFNLTGTAHYHDFGTFLAELENYFPHMRVRKLDLTPGYPGEADSAEAERLNFQLEIVALFKSTPEPSPAQLSRRPDKEKRN